MLTSSSLATQVPLTINPAGTHAGISSVFAAAVVSSSFCQTLLSDPGRALAQGYMGKSFDLSPDDASLIVSISARSLPDLAQQVVRTLSQ